MSLVSVIVPAYNEEEVIDESYARLKETMDLSKENYELIFINDGSRDRTLSMLFDIAKKDEKVKILSFSRNFGHQCAVTAGMAHAAGDAAVIIDADLQDPPRVILEMLEKWREGYEVVYGKRAKRKGETFFKKLTAAAFYRFLKSMTSVDMPQDTGDFRLIDKKVISAMNSLPEKNRYLRGLGSWVGFKQCPVEYVREERFAGETKYPLKKMIKLALDGIAAFSYKPLKIAAAAGTAVCIFSVLFPFIFACIRLFRGGAFAFSRYDIIFIITFLQGGIFLCLGIIGEYIARICDEVRGRPNFIISESYGFEGDNK